MSRIIVKNLPKSITEVKLRQIFGERGTVTDVQLKHTAEGKFRGFAFVGYQNENEAEDAVKHLNNICIKTNNIVVEPCTGLGDTKKHKAWSKYAPDSVAYKKAHKAVKTDADPPKEKEKKKKKKKDASGELLAKYKNDPLFEEFLQVHAPEETKKLRELDIEKDEGDDIESLEKSDQENNKEEEQQEETEKLANKEISDADYMKELMEKKKKKKDKPKKDPKNVKLYHLKIKDLPYNCNKKQIKQFFKPLTPFSIRVPRQIRGIAYAGFKKETDLKKALMKDKSFIAGKRVSVVKCISGELGDEEANNPIKARWKKQEESLKNVEEIAESGKIFFRNLTYTTTETDIENLFAKFGPVTEVSLPVDSTSGRIKGFGTVTFVMPENAVRAYSELDYKVLHGRMLHLLPGKNRDRDDQDLLEESSNFKKKKNAQQKAQASSSFNWNSLFVGHDAVARIISEKLNMTKKDILLEKNNAAVLLALGESAIVLETKKYLEKEGVVLDSFNTVPTKKKSKTVLLVKNLPERTEGLVIRNMFQKYGTVGRVILPPSGITAIVEFFQPSEAKNAYAGLAYSRFKYTPLYLEWAPEGSLLERQQVEEKADKPVEQTTQDVKQAKKEGEKEEEEEEDEEPEEDTTLFVKNLNFQTTDVELTKHFEPYGRLVYANVAIKKDKINPQNKLSMGYGFVRYYEKKCADKALTDAQQSILDGKSLELKRSQRVSLKSEVQNTRKVTKKTKQTGTKILVRNVPFEAKSTDILKLFETYGEIKAVRLPKKKRMDTDSHRGFAFVDFVSASDAKKAFEILSLNSHLYGRRLVLEWASQEEDVDQIRKRTADHFQEPEQKSKKSVFSID